MKIKSGNGGWGSHMKAQSVEPQPGAGRHAGLRQRTAVRDSDDDVDIRVCGLEVGNALLNVLRVVMEEPGKAGRRLRWALLILRVPATWQGAASGAVLFLH